MSGRPATTTEADLKRAIRAMQAAGLVITRLVARKDGIAIETDKAPSTEPTAPVDDYPEPVF